MKKVLVASGVVATVGGLATAVFMSSCDPCEYAEQPSVIIHVVDQDMDHGNRFVDPDSVRYEWTSEYGDVESARGECIGNDCSKFKVGHGAPGVYKVYATVCGQEFGSEVNVEAKDGTCEVETVVAELPVDASICEGGGGSGSGGGGGTDVAPELPVNSKKVECTKWAQPSVIVRLMAQVDGRLFPIGADETTYSIDGDDVREREGNCLTESCSVFAAGYEMTGHFKITAKACGEVVRHEVAVQKTADSCHVETEEVILVVDGSDCYKLEEVEPIDLEPHCETKLVPAAFIYPTNEVDGVIQPHGTQDLIYVNEGERHQGFCGRRGPNDQCTMWVVGWNDAGRFQAFTDTCGVETAFEFTVDASENGCYPITRHLMVDVDTRGCIRAPSTTPPPVE